MLIAPKLTQWITPDWPAPAKVRALVSTRAGGFSRPPYEGFNTALHVGDNPSDVLKCRQLFLLQVGAKRAPQWLDQVHGVAVAEARDDQQVRTADACYTREQNLICTLHTADCLPVLFCDSVGRQVAAAHAGWRGLDAGVLENALASFDGSPGDLMCWLGPAISQPYFEVGPEVRARFQASQDVPAGAFIPSGRVSEQGEHFLTDLFSLARARLQAAGVKHIYGGDCCTYSDPRFFSYRRQNPTGRILSAIWIQSTL